MPARRLLVFPVSCVLCLVLFLSSCRKPLGTDWDVDVVFPIVTSKLDLTHFVPDSILSGDSTGLLHLTINREVASLKLDSLVKLPDIDTTLKFPDPPFPFDFTLQPGEPVTSLPPSELNFEPDNGIELILADVRSGFLHLKFSNYLTQPLDLIYQIPSATKNGQPLTISETVPPGLNSIEKTYDLNGYRFDLTGLHGNNYNTLVQTYTLALNKNASSTVLPFNSYGAAIEVSYSQVVPQYVQGFFGQSVQKIGPDSADFSILSGLDADNFMLSEAHMKFTLLNSIGTDFAASLPSIYSINTRNGNNVKLNSPQLNLFHVNWPDRSGNTVTPNPKVLSFDQTNSNLTSFISNLPDLISFQGSFTVNPPPGGDIVGHNNYAFYGSGISILADVDIPMRFTANRFRLEKVVNANVGNSDQLNNVRSGDLVLSATNGFPFDAKVQAYMIDEYGVVIDSIFASGGNTIRRGQVDGSNVVTAPVFSELRIGIDPHRIDNLKKTKHFKLVTIFTLPPNPPEIKLFDNYVLDMRIHAELYYNVAIR